MNTSRQPAGSPRPIWFHLADAFFLVVVGILSTLTMFVAHRSSWGFLAAMLAGMALAMFLQMLLALLVSPLLGSIESMVPSMVVAMLSPMSVCALHMLGCEPDASIAASLGALFGIAMFLFIALYARASRRWIAAAFPER